MSTTAPLALSDEQLTAVYAACQPLSPQDRDPFLRALAALLREEREIGDGVVARAIRALQREFFRPPTGTAGPQPHRRHVGPAIE
jgi:hypothetical protein